MKVTVTPMTATDKRLRKMGKHYVGVVYVGDVGRGYAVIAPDGAIGKTRLGKGCQVCIRERDKANAA